MITEVGIKGFKSFGSPPLSLKLSPLNVLVGANATGKSNLLSALRFLRNAVLQNVDYAVGDLEGVTEVRNKILRQREKKTCQTLVEARKGKQSVHQWPVVGSYFIVPEKVVFKRR
jgi:predicted ATPase